LARERYGLGFGTRMGTLQTTFRCWGEGEPSSEMSDDSDGDGEMSCSVWDQFGGTGRRVFVDVLAWVKGGNWSKVLP